MGLSEKPRKLDGREHADSHIAVAVEITWDQQNSKGPGSEQRCRMASVSGSWGINMYGCMRSWMYGCMLELDVREYKVLMYGSSRNCKYASNAYRSSSTLSLKTSFIASLFLDSTIHNVKYQTGP